MVCRHKRLLPRLHHSMSRHLMCHHLLSNHHQTVINSHCAGITNHVRYCQPVGILNIQCKTLAQNSCCHVCGYILPSSAHKVYTEILSDSNGYWTATCSVFASMIHKDDIFLPTKPSPLLNTSLTLTSILISERWSSTSLFQRE